MTSPTEGSTGTLDTRSWTYLAPKEPGREYVWMSPMDYKRVRIGWLAKQLRLLAAEGDQSPASVEQSVALALSEWPVSVEELKGIYRARL